METNKRMIVFLNETDLKESAKNKHVKDISAYDFTELTGDIMNKAWYIGFRSDKGVKVFKNKGEVAGSYTPFIKL